MLYKFTFNSIQDADIMGTISCLNRIRENSFVLRTSGVSCCCVTHLEQSATSRQFSTISTDFPKKRLKPFLSGRSLRPDSQQPDFQFNS